MLNDVKFLMIEPTTRCNLNCSFCVGRHLEQTDINLNIVRNILKYVSDISHFLLQGEGEPFLYSDYFEMMVLVKKQFPNALLSTISNGLLLKKSLVKNIVESGLNYLSISIESADPKMYKKFRGGNLNTLITNLKNLNDYANSDKSSNLKIGFAVTLMKENIEGLEDIINLYNNLGLKGGIRVQTLFEQEIYQRYYSDELKQNIIRKDDLITGISNFPQTFNKLKTLSNPNEFSYQVFSKSNPKLCPYLDKFLFINSLGNVLPCCMLKKEYKNGFGNILTDSIEHIVNNREKMKETFMSGEVPNECIDCNHALNHLRVD